MQRIGSLRLVTPDAPATEHPEVRPSIERGLVTVSFGALSERLDLAGFLVSEVRQLLEGPLNLAPEAVALLNGRRARRDRRLRVGDSLEFVREAGDKGGGA